MSLEELIVILTVYVNNLLYIPFHLGDHSKMLFHF